MWRVGLPSPPPPSPPPPDVWFVSAHTRREWQLGREIRPFTMPLMTLAATSIDRVPLRQDIIISDLLRFFHTDAACCRAEAGSVRTPPLRLPSPFSALA